METEETKEHKQDSPKVVNFFLRLSIAKKMFVGYISLFALIVIISFYALTNLNLLNNLNRSILETDVPVIEASDDMVDTLLAQESYIRRYAILKSPDILKVFWERSGEFAEYLKKIEDVPEDRGYPTEEIHKLHKQYDDFLVKGYKKIEDPTSKAAQKFDKEMKERQDEIVTLIRKIVLEARNDQNRKTAKTSEIGSLAFKVAATLCVVGFLFAIAAAIFITLNISGAINRLKVATERMAEGEFNYDPKIKNDDEVGDLARAFVKMGKRLKELEETHIDASPLTRLSGGITIEHVLTKRINANLPIAFCFMDLDNFKAYNDHYGYAKGNDLIAATAGLIENVVGNYGNEDDFIGHIGGDDFVAITTPEKYAEICTGIVNDFDEMVPGLYDEEDRARGSILGKNRQGDKQVFPLASISIAVVTNSKRTLKSHVEYGEIAAELKECVKAMPGSAYVVDHRRKDEREPSVLKKNEETPTGNSGKIVQISSKEKKKNKEA